MKSVAVFFINLIGHIDMEVYGDKGNYYRIYEILSVKLNVIS